MDLTLENKQIIQRFLEHCKKELGIESKFKVKFVKKGLKDPTAGVFNPNTKEITICCKNRAIADCLRTLAHELTHLRQLETVIGEDGFPTNDEDLQPYEDEANISSGKLVRFWGREHKEIYSDLI